MYIIKGKISLIYREMGEFLDLNGIIPSICNFNKFLLQHEFKKYGNLDLLKWSQTS